MEEGPLVTSDDPWGYGGSLEWATSCPPPRHNFTSLPRIRSERPAFDLHHPDAAPGARPVADQGTLVQVMGPADIDDEHATATSGEKEN